MSPKNSLLTAGLTALGLYGFAATRAAAPGDPPAPPPAQAPSEPQTVLLKSNGQILRGVITEEEGKYVVRQYGNAINVPKDQAEGKFDSPAAAYRYKRSLVPDIDPDEHMKLARWCLSQNLFDEAREEVQLVLKLSPTSRDAKGMLASIDASKARLAAKPRLDPGLVQTGGEMVERPSAPPPGAPAEIDAAVLQRAAREMGVKGLPVIFDLPPAVAARRADEFARAVHPILQAYCAKCHNESHEGSFQLIEIKSRKERTNNVFRANLDATLRLIDQENPERSALLSSSLIPHGNTSSKRPIFSGSNDQRFRILSAWVNSLKASPARSTDGVIQARFGPQDPPAAGGSTFASERGQAGGGAPAPTYANPVTPFEFKDEQRAMRPSRYVPGKGFVVETAPPSADEFPVSPLLGGPAKVNSAPVGDSATPPLPGQKPAPGAELPALPGGPNSSPPDDPANAPPKKPKKPVKLDPALLERAILNRNAGGR